MFGHFPRWRWGFFLRDVLKEDQAAYGEQRIDTQWCNDEGGHGHLMRLEKLQARS